MPALTGFPDALGRTNRLDESELSKMSGRLPSLVSVIAGMVGFQRLPRCQRSHSSVFSAAVNPRRNLCLITTHSISYRLR